MVQEIRVVVGASGSNNNQGWIHTQEELSLLKKDDWEQRFSINSVTAILAEHVWEHLAYDEGLIYRSKRFDHRNQNGQLEFVSLIVDAIKP